MAERTLKQEPHTSDEEQGSSEDDDENPVAEHFVLDMMAAAVANAPAAAPLFKSAADIAVEDNASSEESAATQRPQAFKRAFAALRMLDARDGWRY